VVVAKAVVEAEVVAKAAAKVVAKVVAGVEAEVSPLLTSRPLSVNSGYLGSVLTLRAASGFICLQNLWSI
jgi:hypothetical protein